MPKPGICEGNCLWRIWAICERGFPHSLRHRQLFLSYAALLLSNVYEIHKTLPSTKAPVSAQEKGWVNNQLPFSPGVDGKKPACNGASGSNSTAFMEKNNCCYLVFLLDFACPRLKDTVVSWVRQDLRCPNFFSQAC